MLAAREKAQQEIPAIHPHTLGRKVAIRVQAVMENRRAAEDARQFSVESVYEERRQTLIAGIAETIQKIDLHKVAEIMMNSETLCMHTALPFNLATARHYMIEPRYAAIDVQPVHVRNQGVITPVAMPDFCQRIESSLAFRALCVKARKEDLHVAIQVFPVLGEGDAARVVKPLPGEHTPKSTLLLTISANPIEDPQHTANRDARHRYNNTPVIAAEKLYANMQNFIDLVRTMRCDEQDNDTFLMVAEPGAKTWAYTAKR